MMRRLPRPLFLLVLIPAAVFLTAQEGNDPVSDLETAYKRALEEITAPLVALKSHYGMALGKLLEEAQKTGDLNGAVKITDEMRDFDKRMERDFSGVPALHRMRKVYEENLARQEKDFRSKQGDLLRQFSRRFEDLRVERTRSGDLTGALRANEIGEKMAADLATMTAPGTGGRSTFRETVGAEFNRINPFKTDIVLRSGATYRIVPNPRDKWGGGGSKTGTLCNFEGYPGQANNWMRMYSKVGSEAPLPVNPEVALTAPVDGTLFLYAEDGAPTGNVGRIRVEVFVDPPPLANP